MLRIIKIVGANCVRPYLHIYRKIGIIVDKEISGIPNVYENVNIDKYVVMPNHIHMIIVIGLYGSGRTQFAPTISTRWLRIENLQEWHTVII